MSFLPLLVVGGAFVVLSSRKKKKRNGGGQKVLPETKTETETEPPPMGEIFEGHDPPDIIIDEVGSRFSIAFWDLSGSTGHSWRLSATPPDDSIKFIGKEFIDDPDFEPMPGASPGQGVWVFEGVKAGDGSIVFHQDPPGSQDQPPAQVVEIKTRIS